MFDADRPIQNSSQDRLNRTQFANYLARAILDQPEPESMVIGLIGEPGSGKTSLLNLVSEEICYAVANMFDEEKPIVFYFNPWNYSGQGSLNHYFFRDLCSELSNASHFENSNRLISLLKKYISLFTREPVSKLDWFLLRRKREKINGKSGHDVMLIKEELNELLIQQKHKIIIVIDNLSSLSNEERNQLFQIIKSIGDLKNTTYLLVFDKKMDRNKIEIDLEKLVQLPFEVPPILKQDLELILADRLQKSLELVPDGSWNRESWSTIYSSALQYLFSTCRDITRYVNTLNISYPHSKELVDPVDYFVLTAIKVFLPEIYLAIRDNKDLFTDLIEQVYQFDQGKVDKDKLRCDEILSRNKKIQSDVLLELMIFLFPRLRHFYRPNELVYHSESIARKNHRLCCADLFNVYFQLSMQPGQVPESEFNTLISMAVDEDAFSQLLTRLNQDDTVIAFLERLDSSLIKKIHPNNIRPIINALLDNGDLFPEGIQGPLNLNTYSRIHRIIHGLLRLIDTPEERFLILQTAISKTTKSIYTAVFELKAQTVEHEETLDTFLPLEFRDLLPEQLDSLKQLVGSRIEYWGKTGRLLEHPKLFLLLDAWKEWDLSHHCRDYVEKLVASDKGLVIFLVSVLNKPISEAITQYEKNPAWSVYLDAINELIPYENLIPRAKLLFEDPHFEKLREKEQLALMIFLDLTHADTIKIIPQTTV